MIRSVRISAARSVTYTLVCVKNRTTLLLQALPQGRIKLYAPAGYSLRAADRLVRDKSSEIDAAHARMEEASDTLPGTLLYEGTRKRIVAETPCAPRIVITDDQVIVRAPQNDAALLNAQIKRRLVKDALEKIRLNLDKWSPSVNVPYGRVTVREQRTRWGSCSSKHNLNFNWKLIMAPPACLEYVVIHELCHLLYLNHSERFWAEVKKRMPDYEIWKKWLKAHGSELKFPQ